MSACVLWWWWWWWWGETRQVIREGVICEWQCINVWIGRVNKWTQGTNHHNKKTTVSHFTEYGKVRQFTRRTYIFPWKATPKKSFVNHPLSPFLSLSLCLNSRLLLLVQVHLCLNKTFFLDPTLKSNDDTYSTIIIYLFEHNTTWQLIILTGQVVCIIYWLDQRWDTPIRSETGFRTMHHTHFMY